MHRSVIVVKPPKAQPFLCMGQLLWVNLLRHRCYSAEVFLFGFSSEMENRSRSHHFKRSDG